ncbi:hypothetical protein IC614_02930 [Allosphingosinicella flava]|uniref:Uncharacterized protein n=1 Tax=Allosphingosinicella flava TaxID=2771430 RepID=A0A7T2GKM3_9SPHN|nr:hypothetical protein [Sphingosinicella flava]QPQ55572.1 hypothetical protein IC614_02930 [Sphingosinicella flava]
MFSIFKTARENARKAAEYDAIAKELGVDFEGWSSPSEQGVDFEGWSSLSEQVAGLKEDREFNLNRRIELAIDLRIVRAENKKLATEIEAIKAQRRANLKQFQPKAAAEKKVDA